MLNDAEPVRALLPPVLPRPPRVLRAHDTCICIACCCGAGGRLIFQYKKKRTSAPKCGATGVKLQGVRTELGILATPAPCHPPPSPLPSPALPSPHPVALSRIAPALQASGAVRGSVRECSGGNVHVCMQISARRPNTLPNIAKRHKNVSRIYGGHLSHGIVKERYVDIPASTVDAADCQQRRACVPNTGCFHPAQPDQFYMMICRAEQDHPSLPHRGAEDREARSQSSDEEGSRVNASVGAMPRWSMARCRLGLQRCCVPQQSIAALWSPNAA